MGWVQGPTSIEEDNQACIYHSKAAHMTRNLKHLDLTENWVKEKVADGIAQLLKLNRAITIRTLIQKEFLYQYLINFSIKS